jgi:hypothetical protein
LSKGFERLSKVAWFLLARFGGGYLELKEFSVFSVVVWGGIFGRVLGNVGWILCDALMFIFFGLDLCRFLCCVVCVIED